MNSFLAKLQFLCWILDLGFTIKAGIQQEYLLKMS